MKRDTYLLKPIKQFGRKRRIKMNELVLKPIAYIENDFNEEFGIPRQGGLIKEITGKITFTEEYRNPDALRGLEGYSHLWLIWGFSENKDYDFHPTVRPPLLGGNKRMGVFATRSPYRPNPLGLSVVRLERIDLHEKNGPVLYISGADLLNGTPIYDLKPYLAYVDSYPEALGGFTDNLDFAQRELTVQIDGELLQKVPQEKHQSLLKVLALDPRPGYQRDENKIYGLSFGGFNISFQVQGKVLTVENIDKINP